MALAACAPASGHPGTQPGRLALPARTRDLETAVWALGPAHQHPGRYRTAAEAWLATMLASAGPAV